MFSGCFQGVFGCFLGVSGCFQVFSGCFWVFSGVFGCFQVFSGCFQVFSGCFRVFSGVFWVFSGVFGCFGVFSPYSYSPKKSLFGCYQLLISFLIPCESFIEPEMFPCLIGDEVSCPAVCDLVDDNIGQRSVPSYNTRCDECQTWVLHSS